MFSYAFECNGQFSETYRSFFLDLSRSLLQTWILLTKGVVDLGEEILQLRAADGAGLVGVHLIKEILPGLFLRHVDGARLWLERFDCRLDASLRASKRLCQKQTTRPYL